MDTAVIWGPSKFKTTWGAALQLLLIWWWRDVTILNMWYNKQV